MSAKQRVLLAWSSGKDSAWTLYQLQQNPDIEIVGLLTTFNEAFDRVAMHAVRRVLTEQQAQVAGLPLFPVHIPWPCSNADYEKAMDTALTGLMEKHQLTHVAFGDLFLEDIRQYREEKMRLVDIDPLFPIWGLDTNELAEEMISAGLKARVSCIDPRKLPESFAGRLFNREFLKDLPDPVDPCGENGEFHTFVFAGPMFNESLSVEMGEVVERDNFVFADILPLSK